MSFINKIKFKNLKRFTKRIFLLVFCTYFTACGLFINNTSSKHHTGNLLPPQMASLEQDNTVQLTVSGQILDWRAKPLADATISIASTHGEKLGVTDQEGNYILQIEQSPTDELTITITSSLGKAELITSALPTNATQENLDLMFCSDNSIEIL